MTVLKILEFHKDLFKILIKTTEGVGLLGRDVERS